MTPSLMSRQFLARARTCSEVGFGAFPVDYDVSDLVAGPGHAGVGVPVTPYSRLPLMFSGSSRGLGSAPSIDSENNSLLLVPPSAVCRQEDQYQEIDGEPAAV